MNLRKLRIETPLGQMIAVADEKKLHLLDFTDKEDLLVKLLPIPEERTSPLCSIQKELEEYFMGKRKIFTIPIHLQGTPFQQDVWQALKKIPFGKTSSYAEMAKMIKNPHAYRAVGSANGKNPLSIIIPCHRVINANGTLGGYASGSYRKKWLLTHEHS